MLGGMQVKTGQYLAFVSMLIAASGAPAGTEVIDTQPMSFEACKAVTARTLEQLGLSYESPRVVAVVRTGLVWMTKIYADDAEILITCSQPDQKMVITQTK